MPYIEKNNRKIFDEKLLYLARSIDTTGELNYCITKLIHNILEKNPLIVSYDVFNQMMGVVECVKLELYREVIAKYEDNKKALNGSVSDLDAPTLEDVR